MVEKIDFIRKRMNESIAVKKDLARNSNIIEEIVKVSQVIANSIQSGGKLLICGNGGSAADALHIAGELEGRFQKERKGYPAISLNSDISIITAIANDYGYDDIFARQIGAVMQPDDILLGISTSGNSRNIVRAFEESQSMGGINVLLSGMGGGALLKLADYSIIVPSDVTARIQECHMCIYHIICEMVEDDLSKK